jgi:hypothetical protein
MPPLDLPGFPHAVRVKPKTPRPGGGRRARWKDRDGTIYEWDYQHGKVEKSSARGEHLGGFDPDSGQQTKQADPTRNVEP